MVADEMVADLEFWSIEVFLTDRVIPQRCCPDRGVRTRCVLLPHDDRCILQLHAPIVNLSVPNTLVLGEPTWYYVPNDAASLDTAPSRS
jgi:hypothetical protein